MGPSFKCSKFDKAQLFNCKEKNQVREIRKKNHSPRKLAPMNLNDSTVSDKCDSEVIMHVPIHNPCKAAVLFIDIR